MVRQARPLNLLQDFCPAPLARRCAGEPAVTYHQSVLRTGTTRSREASARVGVTSDGAENAPRLRVANGEDSQESKPPVKRRANTHTASAQDSSPPVPWRWRSRGARIRGLQGTSHRRLAQSSEAIFLPGSPRRAGFPARATDLSDWLSFLVLLPRPTAHHFCYPLPLLYPCADAAAAAGAPPAACSTMSYSWPREV